MRRKSEARREAILAAAAQEFGERGYEGASMSNIVARSGGSKQTLYNYFPSKDKLFVDVMVETISILTGKAYSELVESDDIHGALQRYGERYLEARQSPELLSLFRLVYGESGRSDIGKMLYEQGRMSGVRLLSAYLASAMDQGKLIKSDPMAAANHLLALLVSELIEPVIMRVREPATSHEISVIVARALSVFLMAYQVKAGTRWAENNNSVR